MAKLEPDKQKEKPDLAKEVNAITARLDAIGYLDPLEVAPALTFKTLKG